MTKKVAKGIVPFATSDKNGPEGTQAFGPVLVSMGLAERRPAYALWLEPRLSMWLDTMATISSMPGLLGFLGSKQSGLAAM